VIIVVKIFHWEKEIMELQSTGLLKYGLILWSLAVPVIAYGFVFVWWMASFSVSLFTNVLLVIMFCCLTYLSMSAYAFWSTYLRMRK